jgi:hypothetical protein
VGTYRRVFCDTGDVVDSGVISYKEDVKTPHPSHLTFGWARSRRIEVGLPGTVLSVIAAEAGTVLYWAVTDQAMGIRLSTVDIPLTIAGASRVSGLNDFIQS